MLYASETPTVNKKMLKKLEAKEMWFSRTMQQIPQADGKTNEDIIREVSEQRKLVKMIRKRLSSWACHEKTEVTEVDNDREIQGGKVGGESQGVEYQEWTDEVA